MVNRLNRCSFFSCTGPIWLNMFHIMYTHYVFFRSLVWSSGTSEWRPFWYSSKAKWTAFEGCGNRYYIVTLLNVESYDFFHLFMELVVNLIAKNKNMMFTVCIDWSSFLSLLHRFIYWIGNRDCNCLVCYNLASLLSENQIFRCQKPIKSQLWRSFKKYNNPRKWSCLLWDYCLLL